VGLKAFLIGEDLDFSIFTHEGEDASQIVSVFKIKSKKGTIRFRTVIEGEEDSENRTSFN